MVLHFTHSIKEPVFRELANASSIDAARVIGLRGGYAIVAKYGANERVLETTRSRVRLFTLETAAKFLRELGITRFEVDAATYEPGRIRKPRPDRAEALRKTRTRPRQATLV